MFYEEIQAQIADLQAQAEVFKREEKQQAIDAARAMIVSYGITARDLGLDKPPKLKAGPKPGGKIPPKYRDPLSGALWSGRGKTPKWFNGSLDPVVYSI
jgi:DNA-binding protein H-NS